MTARLYGMWSLLGTGLRGLRSRLLLTAGSILLAAISVGAAVVGPMYQAGAASSYLVTSFQSEPNFLTGLVLDYQPADPGQSYAAALSVARSKANAALNDAFGQATLALRTERLSGFPGYHAEATLLSAKGECSHVQIVGRCPSKPGEALILKEDSTFAPLKIGGQVKLGGVPETITVVGTYSPRTADESYWFNLRDLESVPPQPTASGMTSYFPAPILVAPQTFARIPATSWYVRATRRLTVNQDTTLADLQRASRAAAAIQTRLRTHPDAVGPGTLTPELGNALVAISHEVQQRRSTAVSTVAPAVVSVILVTLVLLLRLLSAAMDLRRSELALASLRGFSRRQMWVLGLLEPVLIVVIATPIGVAAGYLGVRALADKWLVPGLPMPVDLATILSVLGVVIATLVVAAIVVRESVREPLSVQIAGVRRPGRSGRWALLARLVLVAGALTVLAATLASSRKSSPDATDLALPILLAVAAGLVTTLAAQWLARSWAKWTAGRRGVFTYLASRTIARRREGTVVVLPLTAALAVSVFAAGVYTAAADWRSSDAATLVGADVSYSTKLAHGSSRGSHPPDRPRRQMADGDWGGVRRRGPDAHHGHPSAATSRPVAGQLDTGSLGRRPGARAVGAPAERHRGGKPGFAHGGQRRLGGVQAAGRDTHAGQAGRRAGKRAGRPLPPRRVQRLGQPAPLRDWLSGQADGLRRPCGAHREDAR